MFITAQFQISLWGYKSLECSTPSITAWEYENLMKVQFSQSGDDHQHLCLHVSKMASLNTKVIKNYCKCFCYLVRLHGNRLTWALSYLDYRLFLHYGVKKEVNDNQNFFLNALILYCRTIFLSFWKTLIYPPSLLYLLSLYKVYVSNIPQNVIHLFTCPLWRDKSSLKSRITSYSYL